MWRSARPEDDDAIAEMALALESEDPGPDRVPVEHIRRTLTTLRNEPSRGRACVLEVEAQIAGYTFLISFWSNELGGEVCTIDELYVRPAFRGQGFASGLLVDLAADRGPWPPGAVALALETTPTNERARRLYERVGFTARNIAMRRRLQRRPSL